MSFPTKTDNSRSLPEKGRGLSDEGFDPITELERIRKEWDTELCSFSASAEETQTLSALPESLSRPNSKPSIDIEPKSYNDFSDSFDSKEVLGSNVKHGEVEEIGEIEEENGDFFEVEQKTAVKNVTVGTRRDLDKKNALVKKDAIGDMDGMGQDVFASISNSEPNTKHGIHARPDSRSPAIYSQISHPQQSTVELSIPKENKTSKFRDQGKVGSPGENIESNSWAEFGEQNLFGIQKQGDLSRPLSETKGAAFRPAPLSHDTKEQIHETEPSTPYHEQTSAGSGGNFSQASNFRKSSFELYRIDPPHTQSATEDGIVIVPRNDLAVSELFGWFCVALGLVGVIVGTLFYLKGILSEMLAVWSYGMPIALVGALVIVFGLLIQLRRLMKLRAGDGEIPEKSEKDRYVAKQLIEIQERLEELRLILNEEHLTKTQPYPSVSSSSSSMPM